MIGPQALQWREPLWLLLALYPLGMLLLTQLLRRWRHDHYAERQLLPWVVSQHHRQRRQSYLRHAAAIASWCCFAIAMAGPRVAEKIYHTDTAHYAEVMIVLDLSQSMMAKDVLPNRLQRARLELLDFLQRADQTRIGLTVFAARPHLLSPLTYDKTVIRHYLAALKPSLLPTAGSNINAALRFAARQFAQTKTVSRAILLISDGDSADAVDHEVQQNTARQLNQLGIHVYSLGVGTLAGQAIVAQMDSRYPPIQTSISTLQRASLQQMASLTNGAYADVSDDDSDWQQLYSHGMAELTSRETVRHGNNNKTLWRELYHVPLMLAFVFFILGLVTPARSDIAKKASASLVIAVCAILISSTPPLQAAEVSYTRAYQLYQKGNYKQAGKLFAQLPGYTSRLGEANALYRLGDYANARNTYIQAVLAAANDQQRATALFNLGNTFFKLENYREAEKIYVDCLRYQPHYTAAQNNLTQAQLQRRLKESEEALTYRAGRGPRMARAAAGLDLSNSQVSLGKSTNAQVPILPSASTVPLPSTTTIQQLELASQQVETDADSDWTYRLDTLAALQTQLQHLQTDSTYVWQRLFEQEEGFAAPLLRPYPLPGVSPW